jgi:hypothetical protein
MAKLITMYIPNNFKRQTKFVPSAMRGKILWFPKPKQVIPINGHN